jgi:hypothetical protein
MTDSLPPWLTADDDTGPVLGLRLRDCLETHGILLLVVLAVGAHYAAFVLRASEDIVFQDVLTRVPLLEKMYAGRVTAGDLWEPVNLVHRGPVNKAILLLNARFFALQARWVELLGALWIGLASFILYGRFQYSLRGLSRWQTQVLFLPIPLILGSLAQWSNILFCEGTYQIMQVPFFMLAFAALDSLLACPSATHLRRYVVAVVLATLVVCWGYSVSAALSLVAACTCIAVFDSRGAARRRRFALAAAMVAAACCVVYLHGLDAARDGKLGLPSRDGLSYLLRYGLHVVSAEAVGGGWLDVASGEGGRSALGLGLLLLQGYALFVGARRGVHRRSVVPFLLITYSLLLALTLVGGRSGGGLHGALASRFITHTQLGMAGCYWLLWLIVEEEARAGRVTRLGRVALGAFACVLAAGLVSTTVQEWRTAPHRKAYYRSMRITAYAPDLYEDKDLAAFQADPRTVRRALAFFREHRLSVFSDRAPPTVLEPVTYGSGWYRPEGGGRWMGKTARTVVRTGATGEVAISGSVSAAHLRSVGGVLTVSAWAQGAHVAQVSISEGGGFTLPVRLAPESEVLLRLEVDRTFVPKNVDLGPDLRNLGVFVEAISPVARSPRAKLQGPLSPS